MFITPSLRSVSYGPGARAFDRSFERFIGEAAKPAPRHASQQQFSEDEQAWTLAIDLPGLPREQLDIRIEDAVVRIASSEGAARQVQLGYEFPQAIDAGRSSAKLENGVLTLTLAKQAPQSRAVKLDIA